VKGWRGGRAWITTQSWIERREVVTALLAGKAVRSGARPAPERALITDRPAGMLPPEPWINQERSRGAQGSARLLRLLLPREPFTPVAAADPIAVIEACLHDPTYHLK
jgi:hypothetical protein